MTTNVGRPETALYVESPDAASRIVGEVAARLMRVRRPSQNVAFAWSILAVMVSVMGAGAIVACDWFRVHLLGAAYRSMPCLDDRGWPLVGLLVVAFLFDTREMRRGWDLLARSAVAAVVFACATFALLVLATILPEYGPYAGSSCVVSR